MKSGEVRLKEYQKLSLYVNSMFHGRCGKVSLEKIVSKRIKID